MDSSKPIPLNGVIIGITEETRNGIRDLARGYMAIGLGLRAGLVTLAAALVAIKALEIAFQ